MRRMLAGAALALVLGGCGASYAWVKPNATAEARESDEAACRAEARDLTQEYAYGGVGAPWNFSPWRRPWTGPYADPAWQIAAEQRVFERCMRGRGYELKRAG
ncbi:MAG TPA: hypothetical protein VGT02_00350 [Methylomirabilota bacterium]|nr:hypothetical protein [Methylomirabilota bacterium]